MYHYKIHLTHKFALTSEKQIIWHTCFTPFNQEQELKLTNSCTPPVISEANPYWLTTVEYIEYLGQYIEIPSPRPKAHHAYH